ncbi:MAG: folate family ECF transporter S component [Thermotogae bacterium]|nr:folate family ECF transporter S component [Thermotogota bacterium]RKX46654.1 MAG: folate family ECF transporter S component [Thermotogota bacterium]
MKVTRLAYLSVLTVLTVVLARFASFRIAIFGVEGVRIGIGSLGIYLAALAFGPVDGLVVGAVADIVGYWVSPMGPYMPHFTLVAALRGVVAGTLFAFLFKRKWSLWSVTASIAVPAGIANLWLVPYLLHTLFGMPYTPMMVPRLIAFPFSVALQVLIIESVLKAIPDIKTLHVHK